jgi:hypothetical protein
MHSAASVASPSSASTLTALRELIARRNASPSSVGNAESSLPTGLPSIDQVLGGLPHAALTEIVCDSPSCGGHLLLSGLLATTRQARLRVALVDAANAFDPASYASTSLEHLIWVRPRTPEEALAATDLLARDANLAWVVLDLRGVPLIRLSRLPSLPWYRLQRAVESSGVAGLILSPLPLIPCSRVRLRLRHSHAFATLHEGQSTLATQLQAEVDRNRSAFVHVAGA